MTVFDCLYGFNTEEAEKKRPHFSNEKVMEPEWIEDKHAVSTVYSVKSLKLFMILYEFKY